MVNDTAHVVWLESLQRTDVPQVGGKSASLDEILASLAGRGANVPPGFALTAGAFRQFIEANDLQPIIFSALIDLDDSRLSLTGAELAIRRTMLHDEWPEETARTIRLAYGELNRRTRQSDLDTVVRPSATAEDLPEASLAGQQETYLDIRSEHTLLDACRRCHASLFTGRVIGYRQTKGVDHLRVTLSIGVQRMVRSDLRGASAVFFIDAETGFDKSVLINAAWGLDENAVQGEVDPDEYEVFEPLLSEPLLSSIVGKKLDGKSLKMICTTDSEQPTKNILTSKAERAAFVLSDRDILALSRWVCVIGQHYGQPMDIEWARGGFTGEVFVVQTRPETVESRHEASAVGMWHIKKADHEMLSGINIGEAVAAGKVCIIESPSDMGRFVDDAILVTQTTDPDRVPVVRRAAAIITDQGGRTSYVVVVSRGLGLPAIIGVGNTTHLLHNEQGITVSCTEGREGLVYEGIADFTVEEIDFGNIPAMHTKVMLNLVSPAATFH